MSANDGLPPPEIVRLFKVAHNERLPLNALAAIRVLADHLTALRERQEDNSRRLGATDQDIADAEQVTRQALSQRARSRRLKTAGKSGPAR